MTYMKDGLKSSRRSMPPKDYIILGNNVYVRTNKRPEEVLNDIPYEDETAVQETTSPHKEQDISFQLWEEVKQAVKSTIRQGLWWSSRSWSVVYRICQIKGYMNGFSQFARDVNSWGIDWEFNCNYDAIQKPTCKGFLSGNPDTWVAKGAPQQFEKLGSALLLELDNLIK